MQSSIVRLAAVASVLVAAPAAALVHNKLVKSAPLGGSAVAAPKAISLWFAETPELAVSRITLLRADSTAVTLGAVASLGGEKNAITAPVPATLAAGDYIVQFRTVGSDGHPLRGSYKFKVQ